MYDITISPFGLQLLTFVSTINGGNSVGTVREGSSARKSVRCRGNTHGGARNRAGTVRGMFTCPKPCKQVVNGRVSLQHHVSKLGKSCTIVQQNELLERRRKLEARISAYGNKISVLIQSDNNTMWSNPDNNMSDTPMDPLDQPDDEFPEGWYTPEDERITLPSSLAVGEVERLSLQPIAMIEMALRKGQISYALHGLRLALGEKSLCFRTQVCRANTQRTTSHAWDNVHKLDAEAWTFRHTYRLARSALQRLSAEPEYMATLHDITDNDLKVAGDLTDERRIGQRSDSLAWFWRTGYDNNANSPQMEECMFRCPTTCSPINTISVYRVSWLRAKARYSRWAEELRLVELEMGWTVNWFRWKKDEWTKRLNDLNVGERPAGLDSYCHKQVALWDSLAEEASQKFSKLLN